jgi:hypothetical protein
MKPNPLITLFATAPNPDTPNALNLSFASPEDAQLGLLAALCGFSAASRAWDEDPTSTAAVGAWAMAYIAVHGVHGALQRAGIAPGIDFPPDVVAMLDGVLDSALLLDHTKWCFFPFNDGVPYEPRGVTLRMMANYSPAERNVMYMQTLVHGASGLLDAGQTHVPEFAELHRAHRAAIAAKKLENGGNLIAQGETACD